MAGSMSHDGIGTGVVFPSSEPDAWFRDHVRRRELLREQDPDLEHEDRLGWEQGDDEESA